MKNNIVVFFNTKFNPNLIGNNDDVNKLKKKYNVFYLCTELSQIKRLKKKDKYIYLPHRQNTLFNLFSDLFSFKNSNISFTLKKNIFNYSLRSILRLPLIFLLNLMPTIIIKKIIYSNFLIEKNIYKILVSIKPKVILSFSASYSFLEFILCKFSKINSIKSIVVVNNWDNLTTKFPILIMPSLICLWGKEMKNHFKKIFYFETQCPSLIIGSSRYQDLYKSSSSKKRRGIYNFLPNKSCKIVLFSESIRSVNTIFILQRIDKIISKMFPKKILIIFRPHPYRKLEKQKEIFKFKFKNIILDPSMKKSFEISKKRSVKESDLDKNFSKIPFYMNRTDGIITQISSFILDSFIYGIKPLVLLEGGIKNQFYLMRKKELYLDYILNKKKVFLHEKNNIDKAIINYFTMAIKKKIPRVSWKKINYIINKNSNINKLHSKI